MAFFESVESSDIMRLKARSLLRVGVCTHTCGEQCLSLLVARKALYGRKNAFGRAEIWINRYSDILATTSMPALMD